MLAEQQLGLEEKEGEEKKQGNDEARHWIQIDGEVFMLPTRSLGYFGGFSEPADAFLVIVGDAAPVPPTQNPTLNVNVVRILRTRTNNDVAHSTLRFMHRLLTSIDHDKDDRKLYQGCAHVDFSLLCYVFTYLGSSDAVNTAILATATRRVKEIDCDAVTAFSAFIALGVHCIDLPPKVITKRCNAVKNKFSSSHRQDAARFITSHGLGSTCLFQISLSVRGQPLHSYLGVPQSLLSYVATTAGHLVIAGGAAMASGCDWLEMKAFSDVDIFVLAPEEKEEGEEKGWPDRKRRKHRKRQEPEAPVVDPAVKIAISLLMAVGYVVGRRSPSVITCIGTREGQRTVQFIGSISANGTQLVNDFELNACRAFLCSDVQTVQVTCDAIVDWDAKVCTGSSTRQVKPRRFLKMKLKGFALSDDAEEHINTILGSDLERQNVEEDIKFGFCRFSRDIGRDEAMFRLRRYHRLQIIDHEQDMTLTPLIQGWIEGKGYIVSERHVTLRDRKHAAQVMLDNMEIGEFISRRGLCPFVAIKSEYAMELPLANWFLASGSTATITITDESEWSRYWRLHCNIVLAAIEKYPGLKGIKLHRPAFNDIKVYGVDFEQVVWTQNGTVIEKPKQLEIGTRVKVNAVLDKITVSEGKTDKSTAEIQHRDDMLRVKWRAQSINIVAVPGPLSSGLVLPL